MPYKNKPLHFLLLNQLEKSKLDFSSFTNKEDLKIFLDKISSFYYEQDAARERITNSLTVSSQEMDRLYKELESNTKKMIFESKMIILGEMAAGVAHEVNNPLMILSGSLELLQESLESTPTEINTNLMKNMEKSIDRIQSIVKGLKTFSRNGENDALQKFSLKEILKDSLALCEEKLKINNIKFSKSIPESGFIIDCRPSQISQVVINLINNSKDAISELTEKWIHLDLIETSNDYLIVITDAGKGIPLDIQEKLFNPFFTTKEVGKGTGLGLSISKGIMNGHQGHLLINNDCPNTQFIISLPKIS